MRYRLLLLLTALLTLAVAAPVVDARPVRVDGRHRRGPRRIDGRSRRGPRRITRRARRRRRHAAPRGSSVTGVWAGEAEFPPPSFAPDADPYTTNIVVRANDGRVTGVTLRVRMECPGIAVSEPQLSIGYRLGKGPTISAGGSFSVTEDGVRVSGTLGANAAAGSISGSMNGCSVGSGASWSATKQRF